MEGKQARAVVLSRVSTRCLLFRFWATRKKNIVDVHRTHIRVAIRRSKVIMIAGDGVY